MSDFVKHPKIVLSSLEERKYQRAISAHAVKENLLVVLPTGLGKTAIALRVAAQYLLESPSKAVLLMAPTRPLVEQHADTVKRVINAPLPLVLTGTTQPGRRHFMDIAGRIVVATPQVIANDIRAGTFEPDAISLAVFDEAHRTRGNYPYVAISRSFSEVKGVRVLGITASPGNNVVKVREIMGHLGVEPTGLEVRDGSEEDVLPYLHGIHVDPLYVDAPAELQRASLLLKKALERHAEALRQAGLMQRADFVNRRDLLEAGKRLHSSISLKKASGESVSPGLWQAVATQSVAMKLTHAIELVETQGVESLSKYLERMRSPEKLRALSTRQFFKDGDVMEAVSLLDAARSDHPKLAKAVELVKDQLKWVEGSRVILFAHYRDTADALVQRLRALNDREVRPARFVGQASKGASDAGLTQKEQGVLLDDFRSGKINCLVATSVAEEGLDIPETDLVVFYEPVPSEIRTIQRRGRTGRGKAGKVVVLLTRGTQDVASHYSAKGKEARMKRMIENLKGSMMGQTGPHGDRQTNLERWNS